jgi:AraC-like DNA-binding protein
MGMKPSVISTLCAVSIILGCGAPVSTTPTALPRPPDQVAGPAEAVPSTTGRCAIADLDERTNAELFERLADRRDPQAEACYLEMLEGFKSGAKETENNARWAARAVAATKLMSASRPLLDVFIALSATRAPSVPNAIAVARPIPVEAPVTSTATPSSPKSMRCSSAGASMVGARAGARLDKAARRPARALKARGSCDRVRAMTVPREHVVLPRRDLAPYVESIRWAEARGDGTYPLEHLPDARATILFRLTADRRGDLSVAGPRTRAHFKLAHRVPLLVRVVFRAGCAYPFLGVPVRLAADSLIPLSYLWGAAAADLGDQLVAARAAGKVIAALEGALVARLRAADVFEPAGARLARSAVHLVADRARLGEPLRVGALAAELGVSVRHLRRAFADAVGLAPKQCARVARLSRALEAPGDWAERARLAGYYDQAHLIGEFRAMLGATPEAHAQGRLPERRACGDVTRTALRALSR